MKSTSARTRTLVREEIPRFEQLLGLGIICFLLILGLGIYLKGKSYDPFRFALDPAALESTRSEVTGKAATLRADDMRGFENISSGGSQMAGSAPVRAKVLPAMTEGFTPMGATEHYLPDTLFEKINGRAPAYIDFNFQELTSRSFTIDAAPGHFADVFIFTMDTPLNAFGIFSLERDSSAIAVDFVQDGYRSEMGYFFRQGKAYVQVIGSDSSPAVMEPVAAFSKALAASIPVDNSGLGARSLLPTVNQIPDSMNFLQSDAYGLSLLRDVYEARYIMSGVEIRFFAMQTGSSEEALAAWEQIQTFNQNYAEITETGEFNGAQYLISDNWGEINYLFIRDNMVGGVMNASGEAAPRTFVEAYLNGETLEAETLPTSSAESEEETDYEGGYGG